MDNSNTHHQRIAKMIFASVYPMYIAKVEKKGRTIAELHQVITWLTGFDDLKLQDLIEKKASFETFFQNASLNPNAHLITGMICGYRVEEIEDAQLLNKLRRLSRADLELLTLLMEGYKQPQIAQLQGCSQSNISQKITRIEKLLK